LSDNLSDVPEDIFQWKWWFLERNRNCAAIKKKIQRKWNKLRGKWQYFNCGATTWVKEDETPNFRTFYWKSSGEKNSDPIKVWWIIEHFFLDNFFEMLCKETNLYYFQN
jgi:hypothetical protein